MGPLSTGSCGQRPIHGAEGRRPDQASRVRKSLAHQLKEQQIQAVGCQDLPFLLRFPRARKRGRGGVEILADVNACRRQDALVLDSDHQYIADTPWFPRGSSGQARQAQVRKRWEDTSQELTWKGDAMQFTGST